VRSTLSKDPAFLFYSSDFLNGVSDLTMEERGQYITLLCLQHQKDELTEKTIRLCVGSVSVDVLSKFVKNENGNYFNERLCDEIEKRKLFTESRRNNGAKGGRPKNKLKPNGLPKKNLMEDVNENENESINEGEKIEKLQIPENFIKVWSDWLDYRKAKKIKNYASLKYEQMALQKLIEYSNSDPLIAEKIILESITNSWTGFFKLKTLNNNQNGTERTFNKNR